MNKPVYNVLFLCSGNSARSIMAEGLLTVLGKGHFQVFSAGTHPNGTVNPLALEMLEKINVEASAFRSKSLDEYTAPGAPEMDFVFTVCDSAREACPVWPGQPMTAHWGFEDPAAVEGSEQFRRLAFWRVYCQIQRRIELFLSLPLDKLEGLKLQARLDDIGRTADSGRAADSV